MEDAQAGGSSEYLRGEAPPREPATSRHSTKKHPSTGGGGEKKGEICLEPFLLRKRHGSPLDHNHLSVRRTAHTSGSQAGKMSVPGGVLPLSHEDPKMDAADRWLAKTEKRMAAEKLAAAKKGTRKLGGIRRVTWAERQKTRASREVAIARQWQGG